MKGNTDMIVKLVTAALAGTLLAGYSVYEKDAGAAPKQHPAADSQVHKVASHVITAKGHTEGTGRYLLTLKGAKKPASVTKVTFRRCRVGDRYPVCASK
jgi:hypothetical protein